MHIKRSAKVDYACRAILELALHWPNSSPLQINEIARRQQIPIKFLTQIMLNLKQLGLVESLRGKSGGYLLSRAPQDIKLSDILRTFGELNATSVSPRLRSSEKHVLDGIWREIDKTVHNALDEMNFEMICTRDRRKHNIVMYEI